jgi:glutamate-1-semialdehyde 2,1-aminomutase
MNKNKKIWKLAKKIIPSGNAFFSKNPSRFKSKNWPTYFSKASGCAVWDLNGKKYYDFSFMGVGTNVLGYANPKIDNEVAKKIKLGNMTTLNSPEEVLFAKQLISIHPWAQMAKFAKTGAEANAIGVRISRAYNNKKKIIICGYHGWHDWYLAAAFKKDNILDTHLLPNLKIRGVPKFYKNFVYAIKYNDINILNKIVKKDKDISCLIMEVQRDTEPQKDYLKIIRKICNKNKIVLIFDECTTGFRETFGGLHLKYGIYPDMAMFGKAIGNGYSITSVIGKRPIMNSAKNTFMSSTFWSERSGYVAGLATIKEMKKIKSWELIKSKGILIKRLLKKEAVRNKLQISFTGLDTIIKFQIKNSRYKNPIDILNEEMLKCGFLFNGSIYVSIAHSKKLIIKFIKNISKVFKMIAK